MKSFRHIFAIIASLLLLSPSITQSQVSPVGAAVKAAYSIAFTAGASGAPVTVGQQKGYYTALAAGNITGWNISLDTGTATFKVWKIAAGTAVPTIANVINTSGLNIASGTHIESATVSDFTTVAVAAGDVFAFDLISATTATNITCAIRVMPLR